MPEGIEPEAFAEYRRCFADPAAIHASCEDYRASASIDLEHDEADADKKISCPVLVLWGAKGFVGRKYDVVSVWKERATNVSGKALPGGHWLAEELPGQTLAEIKTFLLADPEGARDVRVARPRPDRLTNTNSDSQAEELFASLRRVAAKEGLCSPRVTPATDVHISFIWAQLCFPKPTRDFPGSSGYRAARSACSSQEWQARGRDLPAGEGVPASRRAPAGCAFAIPRF